MKRFLDYFQGVVKVFSEIAVKTIEICFQTPIPKGDSPPVLHLEHTELTGEIGERLARQT